MLSENKAQTRPNEKIVRYGVENIYWKKDIPLFTSEYAENHPDHTLPLGYIQNPSMQVIKNAITRIETPETIKTLARRGVTWDQICEHASKENIIKYLDIFFECYASKDIFDYLLTQNLLTHALERNYLNKLPPDAQFVKKIIDVLIQKFGLLNVSSYLDILPKKTVQKELYNLLLSQGLIKIIIDNLEHWPIDLQIQHVDLANQLIDRGEEKVLIRNIHKFSDSIARTIIQKISNLFSVHSKLVAQNLDKFPIDSIDEQKFYDQLIDQGEAKIVADTLQHWSMPINYHKLCDLLLQQGETGAVLNNMDAFPSEAINYQTLLQNALANGQEILIAAQLDKFPSGTVDEKKLYHALITKNEALTIIDTFEKWSTENIPYVDFLNYLMTKNNEQLLKKALSKLKQWPDNLDYGHLLSIDDEHEILVYLIENIHKIPNDHIKKIICTHAINEYPYIFHTFPNAFLSYSSSTDIYAKLYEMQKYQSIITHIESLEEHGLNIDSLSEQEVKILLGHVSPETISNAIVAERYHFVWIITKMMLRVNQTPDNMISVDGLQLTHDRLIEDGRNNNAAFLRKYADLIHIQIARNSTSKDGKNAAPNTAVVEYSNTFNTNIVPHTEAILFYTDEALLKITQSIAHNFPRYNSIFSFSERLKYAEISSSINENTKRTTTWLQWYFIHAINSELTVCQHVHPYLYLPPINPNSLCQAPVEKVLDFLSAALASFKYNKWDPDVFGGPAWVQITAAAYALWATDKPSRPLIDHIFSLEHNLGTLFNKTPDHVTIDKNAMRSVLDTKFESPKFTDCINSLPAPYDRRLRLSHQLTTAQSLGDSLAQKAPLTMI